MDISYNFNLKITYHTIDDLEDSDNTYRTEMLKSFYLNEYDDKVISEKTDLLHANIIKDDKMKKIYSKISDTYNLNNNNDIIIVYLFSYSYFYLFHKCLYDLKNINNITDESFHNLYDKISVR